MALQRKSQSPQTRFFMASHETVQLEGSFRDSCSCLGPNFKPACSPRRRWPPIGRLPWAARLADLLGCCYLNCLSIARCSHQCRGSTFALAPRPSAGPWRPHCCRATTRTCCASWLACSLSPSRRPLSAAVAGRLQTDPLPGGRRVASTARAGRAAAAAAADHASAVAGRRA